MTISLRRLAVATICLGLLSGAITLLGFGNSAGVAAKPAEQPSNISSPAITPRPGPVAAIGDSFIAGIGADDYVVVDGCRRSRSSYAAWFTDRLGAALVDLSCPGATTDHVDRRYRAIPRNSSVVLIQIGGNDIGFMEIAGACFIAGRESCTDEIAQARAKVRTLSATMTRQIRLIQRTAPQASVVVVGYPRILSSPRQCSWLLAPERARPITQLQRNLDHVLRQSARRSDAEFVDWPRRVDRHSLCSPTPWYALPGARIDDLLHPTKRANLVMARHLDKLVAR